MRRPAVGLSEEHGVVLTVLSDLYRARAGPQPAEQIAARTAWPHARTYGVARTRRILRELREAGLARRIATRGNAARWEAQR